MNDSNIEDVYVVMAVEVQKHEAAEKFGCYCVCDSNSTARAVIDKDTQAGDIRPGAWIAPHTLQTTETI